MVSPPGAPPAPARRLRPGPVALAVLAVLVATGTGGLACTRIFAGVQLTILLVGAAVGAVLLTALLRLLRAGPVVAVLVGLVGLVACLVGATAALRDPNGAGLLGSLAGAARDSGARILTSAIPVPATPATVLLPVAATWLTGSVSTVLLGPLRAEVGRAGPRRRAAAVLPPVLLLIGGLVLVGPNGAPSYPVLGGFVVAVAALLAATSRPWLASTGAAVRDGPEGRLVRLAGLRRGGSAVAVLAVLAAVAVLAGPGLAGLVQRAPVDPRSYVTPPRQHTAALNPLGMLAAWALAPKQDLLTVRTDHPARIQWATLSTFNGIGWQADRSYRSAGAVLPAPPPSADRTIRVHQTVTVDALRGGWLPTVAHARKVRGVRVAYDADSGSVFTPDGLSTGLTYRTVSTVPEPSPGRLADASLNTDQERYLRLPPGLPAGIAKLARHEATGTPYQRALKLEKLLRTHYRYWSKAPSGNGYVRLKQFLLTPPSKGGGAGTSEQFATAFALLARVVGLPSRVVVGFHAGHRRPDGRYRVRSGDAFAWPEVAFAGHGWVAFSPTPTADSGRTPPDEDTPLAKSRQQQKKQQLDDAAPVPEASQPRPSASPDAPAAGSGPGVLASALVGGLVALLLVLLGVVLLLRWRRTVRRLDSGPPGGRVLGAWAEVREALRLAGCPPDPALSAAEVAQLAATVAPRPSAPPLTDLRGLAGAVNTVAFAAADGIGATEAAAAVRAARGYRRDLRARFGPLRRLSWRVDPRPLFWH